MRPLPLAAAVAALALHASAATAAPPVGCYGLPSVPEAFVCVTSFTPENAVPDADPGGGTVTIPAFCAGECFGPFEVAVPSVGLGIGGEVAVLVYDGQAYSIAVGEVPPVPPVDVPSLDESFSWCDPYSGATVYVCPSVDGGTVGYEVCAGETCRYDAVNPEGRVDNLLDDVRDLLP